MPFGTAVSMGCYFCSLKSFQSCLIIRTSTNMFLWSGIHLNFISTCQDNIYLGLENCSIFSKEILSLFPTESGPGSAHCPGPICIPDKSDITGEVLGPLVHSPLVNIVTLYLGSKLHGDLMTLTPILNMGSDF